MLGNLCRSPSLTLQLRWGHGEVFPLSGTVWGDDKNLSHIRGKTLLLLNEISEKYGE
jgi:hypothetical protein